MNRAIRRLGLACCCMVMAMPTAAYAQRGGGRFGGRGGGAESGGDDFRSRMLQRLDANGNGLVEADEIPEQARGFVDRIAQNAGVAAGQPIPVFPGAASPNPSGTSSNNTNGNGNASDPYPRVPLFGETTVRGFGVSPETLNGKVVDLEKKYDRRILESVNRTLERYDKNKTGLLEHDEWSTVTWRSDPRESDLDKDGLLTKAELAERYRKGQADVEEPNNRGWGGGPRGGRDGGNGEGGGPRGRFPFGGPGGGPEAEGDGPRRGWRGGPGGGDDSEGGFGGGRRGRGGFRGFDPAAMLANIDRNGNGIIEPDEVDEPMKGFASRMGLSFDKPLPIDEIVRTMADNRRAREGEGMGADGRDKPGENPDKKKAATPPPPANGYRVAGQEKHQGRKSFRQEKKALPKVMPDWWEQRDKDQNGQVALHEFESNVTATSLKEFNNFDTNRDGTITADEAGAVAARGKEK